jgi:DNA polymerase sigma
MKNITQSHKLRKRTYNKKKGKMRWKKISEKDSDHEQCKRRRRDRKKNSKKNGDNSNASSISHQSNDSSTNVIETSKSSSQHSRSPPWITEKTKAYSGTLKLHHEILDFYEFIRPKEEENNIRRKTVDELKNTIRKKWPMWKVKVFGSFPNGLHLTDSDIDIVVFKNSGFNFSTDNYSLYDATMTDHQQLTEIYRYLLLTGFAKEIRYVDARVPILKVKTKNGINLDIS